MITQNVDDLHERAGSQDVIHLHGSLHSPRCIDCGKVYTLPLTSDALPEDGSRIEPPRCRACVGYVRPGVVWFEEMLPEDEWSAALAAALECDVFLSIGTSGIVYPAAELPLRALGHGATVVHTNPVRFEISSQEHFLQGPASVMMQSLPASRGLRRASCLVVDGDSLWCLPPWRGTAVVNQTPAALGFGPAGLPSSAL